MAHTLPKPHQAAFLSSPLKHGRAKYSGSSSRLACFIAHNISETTRRSVETELAAEAEESEAAFARKQAEADARIAAVKAQALSNVDDVASETVQAILDKFTTAKITKSSITSAVSSAKG